ncbi:Glycosyl transferase family 2 [Rubripirellula lacrimiformis]|uniref:Glycosyl transferase family 2 n=1 Tax=Rubripirellula lacrimiformis TaxID=1930273 RepID=A0A517N6N8_9BACT|nr:glycosyltransferase family 2 protein [Rubripirellula lacrimiformis]QDT02797.1 Glycosyl transferase family 2 [Rubripirellula lacrimiformis]
MNNAVERCPFRIDVRRHGQSESATCDFVRRLTGASAAACQVDQSACEICVRRSPLSAPESNPVIASLVLSACEIDFPTAETNQPAGLLKHWAAKAIENEGFDRVVPTTMTCDVILVCSQQDSNADIAATVHGILDQSDVQSWIHLVGPSATLDRLSDFDHHWRVKQHPAETSAAPWQQIDQLLPSLKCNYVAFADTLTGRYPRDLTALISRMQEHGGELLTETTEDECCVVVRRFSLLESGGLDRYHPRADLELIARFSAEDRVMDPGEKSTDRTSLGLRDSDGPQLATIHRNAVPQLQPRHRCDVVLPFRDSLDYVTESVVGLLRQTGAEITIHLVDDDSQGSTNDFFRSLSDYPNIRFYRNSRNLGPFATFNNIAANSDAEFIAVQDADDISLPERIAKSCRLLTLAQADMVGSATELFGDPTIVIGASNKTNTDSKGRTRYLRTSRYPRHDASGYFLENPTLVVRTEAFRRLGGYGDFGEGKRNRTGVDTDFQLRAHYGGASIIVSNEVLVRYRCHRESATQHSDSGFGSIANHESHAEVRRRLMRYRSTRFSPRSFGALGDASGITVPLSF